MKTCANAFLLLLLLLACAARAQTDFTVIGIVDKSTYADSVTVNVPIEGGYTYGVYLNGTNISPGATYTIRNPDFYIVQAFRTNNTTGETTNRYFRIIVDHSTRASTEHGLPSHTPLIAIPSSLGEFSGGGLRLIAPAAFPTGYEIPVVAWAVDEGNKTLRANGYLQAAGHPSIFLRRGVGSGFLGSNNPAGALNYSPYLQGVVGNKTIQLESGTTWTPVSGILSGNNVWPDNSRIYVTSGLTLAVGGSLTIGAGTIVRLNPGVDITNNGSFTVNGTVDQPVIFMPNMRTAYWGGFVMRAGSGQVTATGTIFVGSGAVPNWFGSAGNPGSHRPEQALLDRKSVV